MNKLTWLSLTVAAALVNNNSVVPLDELWSADAASPLLTVSFITTLSLKFWPNTNPEEPGAGWPAGGTVLLVRGVTEAPPRGTNLGASGSGLVSFSLSSAEVSSFSFVASVASVASATFRNGLLPGFSWEGLRMEPE